MSDQNTEPTPRDILLVHLAEQKDIEFKMEDLESDANTVAKQILGQMATSKDLETVESIVRIISKLPNYDKLVEGVKEQVDLPDTEAFIAGSAAWFRRLMGISG
jgi:hypothetical protein